MHTGTGLKLHGPERAHVNSGARAWLMRHLEVPRLMDGVQLPLSARALEIGAGRGFGTFNLLQRYPTARAVVTDFDPEQLRESERFLTRAGLTGRIEAFREADVKALPFSDSAFDVALTFESLHHAQGYAAALRELARVLKPGGLLMLADVMRPRGGEHLALEEVRGVANAHQLKQMLNESGFVIERWRLLLGVWVAVVARKK